MNKKIENLIKLCKSCGIDKNIILRKLQNNNNSSKQIVNQQARFIEEQARNEIVKNSKYFYHKQN